MLYFIQRAILCFVGIFMAIAWIALGIMTIERIVRRISQWL